MNGVDRKRKKEFSMTNQLLGQVNIGHMYRVLGPMNVENPFERDAPVEFYNT